MNFFVIILTFISGFGLSSQAAINGALGKTTGAVEAAFVSFFVGSLGLFLVLLFLGKGNVLEIFTVPKWQIAGGIIGAAYIFLLVFAVPRVGVGISLVSVVCGQMIMSMLIDNYGWFQSKQIPITGQRLLGVALLIVALVLIYRGTATSHNSNKPTNASLHPPGESGKMVDRGTL
jgi:transporter family-2 protein